MFKPLILFKAKLKLKDTKHKNNDKIDTLDDEPIFPTLNLLNVL